MEEERKRLKETQMLNGEIEVNDEEELKFEERDIMSVPAHPRDNRIKATTRNLRIIEDTAKYLFNLNEDSARYDPKSRSMAEDPNPDRQKGENKNFRGDKMAKFTGDAPKLVEQEKFVWEMVKKNNAELNSVAMPTSTEMAFRKFKASAQNSANERNEELMANYGEENKKRNPDLPLIIGQTENYVEYSKDGQVISSPYETSAALSKYKEDIFPRNHNSVWGSFWSKTMGWGFSCCHSFDRESECEGEIGKKKNLAKEFKKEMKAKNLHSRRKRSRSRSESPN